MKKLLLLVCCIVAFGCTNQKGAMVSIAEFGVAPENTPAQNKENLQKAIDWASERGAALYVEPSSEPYPMDGGIILKRNVALVGAQGAVPGGTCHPTKRQPVGSVFKITDRDSVFITVESATKIEGIQFWYPEQTIDDPSKIIEYPATIQNRKDIAIEGVHLSRLTFFGEYLAMDFNTTLNENVSLVVFDHCYGYPLSGEFIRINYCYDIPRITHCHVNPAMRRQFQGDCTPAVIDAVIAKGSYAYSIDHTDNAQIMDIFTFGTYGGIMLGDETYGQLTNFNFDCVVIGIHKKGCQPVNRNWQIAQGSIISNAGNDVKVLHPIVVEGQGHTSLTNVEIFSGLNAALTCVPELQSWDYMLVKGDQRLSVTMMGCRMTKYVANNPVTVENPSALVQVIGCVDKHQNPMNLTINGKNK